MDVTWLRIALQNKQTYTVSKAHISLDTNRRGNRRHVRFRVFQTLGIGLHASNTLDLLWTDTGEHRWWPFHVPAISVAQPTLWCTAAWSRAATTGAVIYQSRTSAVIWVLPDSYRPFRQIAYKYGVFQGTKHSVLNMHQNIQIWEQKFILPATLCTARHHVCPSVTFVYCLQVNIFSKLFTIRIASPTILVFPYKKIWQ